MTEQLNGKEVKLCPTESGLCRLLSIQELSAIQHDAPREYALLVEEDDIVIEGKDQMVKELSLQGNTELLEPFHSGSENLSQFVDPKLQFFLSSSCRSGEMFVPTNGRLNPNYDEAISAIEDLHPISPVMFQESVVERVFGAEFKEKENTPERLRERQKYFPHLRQIIHHLEPLWSAKEGDKHPRKPRRIFVIGFNEHESGGKLIVYRKSHGRHIALVYDNIYDLQRAHIHNMQNYNGRYSKEEYEALGELEQLRAIRQMIQDRIAFYQRWKYTSKQERALETGKIEELRDELKRVTNEFKGKARDQFEACVDILDSIGRQNIPSKSARMVGAGNQILKRESEARGIAKNVGEDQETLNKVVDELHRQFQLLTLRVGTFFSKDVFKDEHMDESSIRVGAGKVSKEFEDQEDGPFAKLLELEADLTVPEPFAGWVKAALSNFRVAGMLLETFNYRNQIGGSLIIHDKVKKIRDKACYYAIRGHCMLRYAFIQHDLAELFKGILRSPQATTAMVIEDRINQILERYRPHAQGGKFLLRDDIEFEDEGYNQISDHLQQVKQIALDWIDAKTKIYEQGAEQIAESEDKAQATLDIDDKILELEHDFLQQIQDYIKEFDFAEPKAGIVVADPNKEFKTVLEELGFEIDADLRSHIIPIESLPKKLFY